MLCRRKFCAALLLLLVCACTSRSNNGSTPLVAADDAHADTPATAPVKECAGTLRKCGETCTDTATNVAHCGKCDASCGAGEVCDNGTCGLLPDDCAAAGGCPPAFYCEPTDHKCRPGCLLPSDCPPSASCDAQTKVCACADGHHSCGQACVADASPESCGQACVPCPEVTNASSTCEGGTCGFACKDGFKLCDGKCLTQQACDAICLPCSAPNNATAYCQGTTCAYTCDAGYHKCGDACAANTSPDSCGTSCSPCPLTSNVVEAKCEAGSCAVSKCASGHHKCGPYCVSNYDTKTCGSSCTPCAAPNSDGKAVCNAGSECKIVCNQGYNLCGSSCTKCPVHHSISETGCSGETCIATSCIAGYAGCGGACELCPEGALDTKCGAGKCVAVGCDVGLKPCGDGCCGLHGQKLDALAMNGPVGAAHLEDGSAVAAWDGSLYSGGMRVVVRSNDGKLGKISTLGTKHARGLSLRVGPKSLQHLAFIYSQMNKPRVLRHATRTGAEAWKIEDVPTPTPGNILLATRMDLTPSGDVGLLVSENLKDQLYYLERSANAWSKPAALPFYAAYEFEMAIAADGTAHTVARNYAGLSYSSGKAGTHTLGPVITADKGAKFPSIAVAKDGAIHAVWADGGGLYLSGLKAGAWSKPILISKAQTDSPTAVVVDSKGGLHVAFKGCSLSGTLCGARYAVQTKAGWSAQTMKGPSNITRIALSLGANDQPAVVGRGNSNGAWLFTPTP